MPQIESKYFNALDVKEGDIITFKDGGQLKTQSFPGQPPKTIIEITIQLPNGALKSYSLKGKNYNDCASGFDSKDTNQWMGRQAKVHVFPNQLVGGKLRTIVQLEPINEIDLDAPDIDKEAF